MRQFTLLLLLCLLVPSAHAREQIRIVGSSTVYPFVTLIAENFGRTSDYATPIVEATGTGGGFKLFCAGVGTQYADVVNASRAIKTSEKKQCAKNGISNIAEFIIGYDGIVIATTKKSPHRYALTRKQLFLALADEIPAQGKLVKNPHTTWRDIDASLPNVNITVYGPPPTSGTRDTFVELVMENACMDLPAFKKAYSDKKARKSACHQIREDGHFVEAGENDNLIVQKLVYNPDALGMFGYSFLSQNDDLVTGVAIDGFEPEFDTIADGDYPIARPLYVYVKGEHSKLVSGLKEFAGELTSDDAVGEFGYTIDRGLIPLDEEAHRAQQDAAANL